MKSILPFIIRSLILSLLFILHFVFVLQATAAGQYNDTTVTKPLEKNTDLPESWVNPEPKEMPTHTFVPGPLQPLVSMGPDGKLVYKLYSGKGDRVPDWSKTGYKQSNVPVPNVPVLETVRPLPSETGHLVYNCYSEDARHDFAGGARTMGPFAFVNSTAVRGEQSEPHHRWGTGYLYDNITTEDGSIAAINRGDSGTGHGWAAANTMIWNCNSPNIVVFDPETEGENNFAIGYTGNKKEGFDPNAVKYANTRSGYWGTPREGKFYGYALMGNGHIESPFAPVEPKSLFVQQLTDRIGLEQAMRVLKDDREAQPGVLLDDPMTGDWQENWFLDGKEATLRTTEDGLFFSAGTVTKSDDPEEYHAHHAVLWTRDEFEGDIKISYEMTRIDDSNYGTTLLYIQAQGIGTPPYVEDISAWNKLRDIPDMATYFTCMDLLSLSFRENLRCKRYPWQDENLEWYPGQGLIEPMVDYGEILPGKTCLAEVEKRASSLRLRLVDKESRKVMIDHTWNTDKIAKGIESRQIQKGRIGLRHMSTRQFIYRNFKVETLIP